MKKHEYSANMNTGDVIAATSKRGLYANLKVYFKSFSDAYYAEVLIDNIPRAFVWKVPRGLHVVPPINR